MREQLIRKCGCCGVDIPIIQETIGELVYFDKKTYHKDCFANLCKKNSSADKKVMKHSPEEWEDTLKRINELRAETIEFYKPVIIKDTVYRIMIDLYQPTIISSRVWMKLDQIYNGTYKGMMRPIPPKHLMDMWRRQSKNLFEMHKKMEQNGKVMDTCNMIIYDLSVLINKYDSYLKWLEKQRIIEMERQNADMDNASIQQIVDPNIIKMSKEHEIDDTDIAALVDEIFD